MEKIFTLFSRSNSPNFLLKHCSFLNIFGRIRNSIDKDISSENKSLSLYFSPRTQNILQEKEGIQKWSESSPRLKKSQIRPTDQSEKICKKPFQC